MPRGPIFRVVVGSQIVAPPTVYKLKKTHTFKHIRKRMKIVCPLTFFIKLHLSPKKKKWKKKMKISTYQIAITNLTSHTQ